MILWVGTIPVPIVELDVSEFEEGIHGEFNLGSGRPEIHISNTLEGEWRDHVIAHEWAHAWLSLSGISNLLDMSDETEEAFCDALAHGVIALVGSVQENRKG